MEKKEEYVRLPNGYYRKKISATKGTTIFKTRNGAEFSPELMLCPICEYGRLERIRVGLYKLPETIFQSGMRAESEGWATHSSVSEQELVLRLRCPRCGTELTIPTIAHSQSTTTEYWEDKTKQI